MLKSIRLQQDRYNNCVLVPVSLTAFPVGKCIISRLYEMDPRSAMYKVKAKTYLILKKTNAMFLNKNWKNTMIVIPRTSITIVSSWGHIGPMPSIHHFSTRFWGWGCTRIHLCKNTIYGIKYLTLQHRAFPRSLRPSLGLWSKVKAQEMFAIQGTGRVLWLDCL